MIDNIKLDIADYIKHAEGYPVLISNVNSQYFERTSARNFCKKQQKSAEKPEISCTSSGRALRDNILH